MSYFRPYQTSERDSVLISDYWSLLSLEKVGKKYHIVRERVRQIMEKNGLNPKEVKRAVLDFAEWHKVEKEFKTCKCGRNFRLNAQRVRRNRAPDLCPDCFMKIRHKLDGYKWQHAWHKKQKLLKKHEK